MNKIAILGDTHFGMRKDSQKFHKFSEQFYQNIFFPFLTKNNITQVYQLGDLFDNRKSINPYSLHESKRYFFSELAKKNILLYTLLGNHDIFWRESLSVSSSSLLLGEYNNIVVIDKPSKIGDIDIIPWICKENSEEVLKYIGDSNSKYCFGHFEIAGFKMYKGAESHDGIPKTLFEKYKLVCSGHYHTRSNSDNILYVGTPMEMTWQDYNDQRGFHTLDLDTGEVEFIPNPYTIFEKLTYDDVQGIIPKDLDKYKEKFIRIEVTGKSDLFKFDNLLNRLYEVGVYDVKVIENIADTSNVELDESISLEDTIGLLGNYIDSVEIQSKQDVKTYLKSLYTKAVNLEIV